MLIGYLLKFLRSVISQLNSDFDHMFGLVNEFCNQKSERSKLNWPNIWGKCWEKGPNRQKNFFLNNTSSGSDD